MNQQEKRAGYYFDKESNRYFSYIELVDELVRPTSLEVELGGELKIISSSGLGYNIFTSTLEIYCRWVEFLTEQTLDEVFNINKDDFYPPTYQYEKGIYFITMNHSYVYEVKKGTDGQYVAINHRRRRKEIFTSFDEALIYLINDEILRDKRSDYAMMESTGYSGYESWKEHQPTRREVLISKGYGVKKT